MFQGASSLSLDAKGRLSVPTRHRDALGATAGQLTITKHPHGCLMVFPRRRVGEIPRARIASLPMQAQWWKRIFLGNAMDVEMDGSGRVLVSPELRAAAGISKDAVLLGMGSYLELWDAATYAGAGGRGHAGRDARRVQGLFLLRTVVQDAWTHQTVLLNEAVDALAINPDGHYVDATFGRGGHSRLILLACRRGGG